MPTESLTMELAIVVVAAAFHLGITQAGLYLPLLTRSILPLATDANISFLAFRTAPKHREG